MLFQRSARGARRGAQYFCRRATRPIRRRTLFFEGLEDRRLLATVFDNGVLTVTGTEGDDDIRAFVADGLLTVEVNGASFSLPNELVSHINVYGESGNDAIHLEESVRQTSRLEGGRGNDGIRAGSGSSVILGGVGNDRLAGGASSDAIFGGEGDDSLAGGAHTDYLIGGSGHDKLSGGTGDDWLFGDATNGYPAGYNDPVAYALDFMDTNRGNDSLEGDEGNDILLAGNGNDRASGGDGRDVILGGRGADGLSGGDGGDVILGDTIRTGAADPDPGVATAIRAVNPGAESLLKARPVVAADEPNLVSYDDTIVGGAGHDQLFGQLGSDELHGNDGSDELWGGVGRDVLFGQLGDDQLDGGAGNDLLDGGDGQDALAGQDGEDKLIGGLGHDYLDGGAGADKIDALDGLVDFIVFDPLDTVDADEEDIFV